MTLRPASPSRSIHPLSPHVRAAEVAKPWTSRTGSSRMGAVSTRWADARAQSAATARPGGPTAPPHRNTAKWVPTGMNRRGDILMPRRTRAYGTGRGPAQVVRGPRRRGDEPRPRGGRLRVTIPRPAPPDAGCRPRHLVPDRPGGPGGDRAGPGGRQGRRAGPGGRERPAHAAGRRAHDGLLRRGDAGPGDHPAVRDAYARAGGDDQALVVRSSSVAEDTDGLVDGGPVRLGDRRTRARRVRRRRAGTVLDSRDAGRGRPTSPSRCWSSRCSTPRSAACMFGVDPVTGRTDRRVVDGRRPAAPSRW